MQVSVPYLAIIVFIDSMVHVQCSKAIPVLQVRS